MLGFSSVGDSSVADLNQLALVTPSNFTLTTTLNSVSLQVGTTLTQGNFTITATLNSIDAQGSASVTPTNFTLATTLNSVTIQANEVNIAVSGYTPVASTLNGASISAGVSIAPSNFTISATLNSVTTPIFVDGFIIGAALNSVSAEGQAEIIQASVGTITATLNSVALDFSTFVNVTGFTITTTLNTRPRWNILGTSVGNSWNEIIT